MPLQKWSIVVSMLYMKAPVRRATATCLSMRAIIQKRVSSTVGTRRISATIATRALYIGDGEGRLPVSWPICICVRVRDCQLRTLIPDLRDMPRSRANTRIVTLVWNRPSWCPEPTISVRKTAPWPARRNLPYVPRHVRVISCGNIWRRLPFLLTRMYMIITSSVIRRYCWYWPRPPMRKTGRSAMTSWTRRSMWSVPGKAWRCLLWPTLSWRAMGWICGRRSVGNVRSS